MKRNLLFSLMLVGLLVSAICASQSMAAVFHVTNATDFQAALDAAETNGEDDTIYLAAGTYQGNFSYDPPETERKSLLIMGEPGTSAENVILDSQNSGRVLYLHDTHETSDGAVANIGVNGIKVVNGHQTHEAGGINATFNKYNISITNCIIKSNIGGYLGGGLTIYVEGLGATVTLENNLILDNSVSESYGKSWGAGVNIAGNMGSIIIRNNIITRNIAQGTDPQGGGLLIGFSNAYLYLIGNTVYSNQANKGGGVYFGAMGTLNAANVYNNIIYGNTATNGGDIYFEGSTNRIGHNNNYSNMDGTWTDFGNNLNTDPLFVDPSNNDFHLQSSSPMISAGTTAVPDPPGLPSTDLEGNPRIIGVAPDIGAYEYSPISPNEGTIGTEITVSGSGFGTKKGKVLVGGVSLKILEWTHDSIRCQLTKALSPETYDVTIRPQIKGSSPITIPNGFTTKTPEIDSADPTSGSVGGQITINGFFFGTKKGKVTLDGKSCKVLSWTMVSTTGESEIRFVVPKGLTSGAKELKVTNGVGTDTVNFTVD